METKKSFSDKMFQCAANNAELTFAKYLNRKPEDEAVHVHTDAELLDMFTEAFLRGALQTITDQAQWIELSQAIQKVYP